MDALRIVDAVAQVTVQGFCDLLLFFHFCGTLLHLRLHFPLVVGQVIAHLQNGLPQCVVLTEWGIFRIKLALTHLQTECPRTAQSVGQSVDRNGHLTDFISAGLHLFLQWRSPSHVNQGTFEFADGPDDGFGHPPRDQKPQDQNSQCHVARVPLQLRPQVVHLRRGCREGIGLGLRHGVHVAANGFCERWNARSVQRIVFGIHDGDGIVVRLECGQKAHDFAVDQKQVLDVTAQGVKLQLQIRIGPIGHQGPQSLNLARDFFLHQSLELDFFRITRSGLHRKPVANQNARLTDRTIQRLQLLNARCEHTVDVPAELLALRQRTSRQQEQGAHRQPKHAEANGYAPSDAPLEFPGCRRVNHASNLTREGQVFAPVSLSAIPPRFCACTRPTRRVETTHSGWSSILSESLGGWDAVDAPFPWGPTPFQTAPRKHPEFP